MIPFPARRYDLLAFGDPTLDLLFTVQRAPSADEKVLGRRLPPLAGGTVANVACAASLLGRAVLAYGRVAADGEGAFLRAGYEGRGVDTAYLRAVPGAVSPTALVLVEAGGEKAVIYAPMPGPTLDEATLPPALAQSRVVYAMPYDLAEFERVHALARAAGTLLAIDVEAAMVPDPAHLRRLLALCDIVFMNDATWRAVLGMEPDAAGMAALLGTPDKPGPALLAVSRGARGAVLAVPGRFVSQAAFATKVVDTTGAGDAFNGALLAALLEGQALEDALRFACAAGSLAVTAVGARSALPVRAQVEAVLAAGGTTTVAGPGR
jgi:sugar/nucleoside kinase (ribokinase family)